MSNQNIDFHWFVKNYDKLSLKYNNRYIVIKNKKVIGDYELYSEALSKTKEPLGSFIIQKCLANEVGYIEYIN